MNSTETETHIASVSKYQCFFPSGLSALTTSLPTKYRYIKKTKSWSNARGYCRQRYTDLATVDSPEDTDTLLSLLQGVTGSVWIGLYDDLKSWRWLMGNVYFNTASNYSSWANGHPHTLVSKQSCTVIHRGGVWTSRLCSSKFPFVCYDDRGPSRYVVVENKTTWYNAKVYCREQYTDLASVRNSSENDHISSLLSSASWIGLYRKNWAKWSDKTPTEFTNWKEKQPDYSGTGQGQCALIDASTGTWSDTQCYRVRRFICQTGPAQHKKMLKLKFNSTADMYDPAVKQQLLEQLQAKLEEQVVADFKLRWIETEGQTFHKEQKKTTDEGLC
ncbi:uncharacterized protein V6R79_011835 [Siganus canaliculatus]